jgi:hypothetical protein
MSDWWNQPTRRMDESAPSPASPAPACPWCAAPSVQGETSCRSCGAVIAQREDLGGLIIPGVTGLDPAVAANSYSSALLGQQRRMSTLSAIGGGVGGTAAQVAYAAAILAKDGLRGTESVDPEEVGKPSQAALDMVRRLNEPAATSASDPWAAGIEPSAVETGGPEDSDPPAR